MTTTTRLFSIFLLLGVTTSCLVSNRAYRRNPAIVPKAAVLDPSLPRYDLAYLEFDDMGEFWTIGDLRHFETNTSASQLAQAMELIEKRKEAGDVVVITFIHGWHNNASHYDHWSIRGLAWRTH